MMALKLEGLEEFKKSLLAYPDLIKSVPDMSIGIMQFHNTLERRLSETWAAPGTLSDVLVTSSLTPREVVKNFATYNLEYKDVPIPLEKYGYEVGASSSISKAPIRKGGKNALTKVKWTAGTWSKKVSVQVGRNYKVEVARRGGNASQLKGFMVNGKIFARKQKATWLELPTKGVSTGDENRAPFSRLYGPSLFTRAKDLFQKDKQVQKAADDILDIVANSWVKYYGL